MSEWVFWLVFGALAVVGVVLALALLPAMLLSAGWAGYVGGRNTTATKHSDGGNQ